jgi:competence protein ComEC
LGINRLDGLILTHDDIDHTGGAASVMQAIPVGWLSSSLPDGHPLIKQLAIRPGQKITQVMAQQAANKQSCMDGQSWLWDGINFEIMHPARNSIDKRIRNDNDLGCVLRISIGDQHILLAADIERQSELRLLKEHADKLPAALLVAPHHGSKTSSTAEFVSAVSPEYAVFTVGYRNRYGHPKQEVMQRYADNGAQLLRSDTDGAILVEMNAQGLQINSYRNANRRYWTHSP